MSIPKNKHGWPELAAKLKAENIQLTSDVKYLNDTIYDLRRDYDEVWAELGKAEAANDRR